MKIVFRADASLEIGAGHIMRCLTLADAMLKRDVDIVFIIRDHPGHLAELISQKGYEVYKLPLRSKKGEESEHGVKNDLTEKGELLFHNKWLGVSQAQDALDCQPILNAIHPDWLIADHYAIDYRWQLALRAYCRKLMVIDDLADRRHECDLLLDQTYGRKNSSYQSLVPADTTLLLGSQYALLRPEFVQWRDYSIRRRASPKLKQLLITMGGVDSNNITCKVLETLKQCGFPNDLNITVVMGTTAPWLEEVKILADQMPYKTEVNVNVSNMAELMANCDFAIGAAGSTVWERCCLGLPSIIIVLAENQVEIASAMQLSGASIVIDVNELQSIKSELSFMTEERMNTICESSINIVDGQGALNTVNKMM